MEIRSSGKIAFGVVGALATIGALHFLIFGGNAERYQSAKSRFEAASGRSATEGLPPNTEEINRFRYESLKVRLQAWETAQELDYVLPGYYGDVMVTGLPKLLSDIEDDLWQYIPIMGRTFQEGISRLGPLPRFMQPNPAMAPPPTTGPGAGGRFGPGMGGMPTGPSQTPAAPPADNWHFQRALPQNIVANLDAVITALDSQDKLIAQMSDGPGKEQQENEYRARLLSIGVDLYERDRIANGAGQLAATFYIMNRADNILRALPQSTLPALSEQQKRDRLTKLLRRKIPDSGAGEDFVAAIRQFDALTKALQLAKDNGIQEIEYVKTHTPFEVKYLSPEEAANAAATPDPMMGGMGGFGMGMEMGMDEEFFFGGMGMFDEGMMGMGMGMGMGAARPKGTPIAVAAPIELRILAPREATMNFLFSLSTGPQPLEIDRLRFEVVPTQPGQPPRLRTTVFVNVITQAKYLEGFNSKTLELYVSHMKNQLAEVAMLPGAREAALADGFLVQDGEGVRLAEPTPTPIPDPNTLPQIVDPATLVTPDPGPQPGMGGGGFGGGRAMF